MTDLTPERIEQMLQDAKAAEGITGFADDVLILLKENATLAAALKVALDGWEYAASYKMDYLREKHGDTEDIARLKKLLRD